MALRTKTVKFAAQTKTGVISDAVFDYLAAFTAYAPETASRTIRAAYLDVSWDDNITATGGTVTEWRVSCQIDSVGASVVTETADIANTGENMAVQLTADFTSYFAANFTGASHGITVGLYVDLSTGTTLQVTNGTAVLVITYEYDDAAQDTRIKTVHIPLEGYLTTLTATLAEAAANQIPALDTFLPEASKVYRSIFFECYANEATTATTNFQLGLQLDSEPEHLSGTHTAALNSARFTKYVWQRNDMATNVGHTFKARSTVAGRFTMFSVVMVVTYEYSHTSSTAIMNSLQLPFEIPSPLGGTAAADASRFKRKLFIVEPGPIALAQSGVLMTFNESASVGTLNLRVGTQAYRGFTHTSGSIACGGYCLSRRFDSGAVGGAGVSLARGENSIVIDAYRTSSTILGSNISGLIYLNYTSGKAAQGADAHNHTTYWFMKRATSAGTLDAVSNWRAYIPAVGYWVTSIGFELIVLNALASNSLVLSGQVKAGEGPGSGWRDHYSDSLKAGNEIGASRTYCRARDDYKRRPDDVDGDRMDIETARNFRLYTGGNTINSINALITWHALSWTIGGDIAGSSGGTVDIRIFRADTHEYWGSTSRVGNGAWSYTVYNNSVQLYAVAYESGTLLGRSDNITPV
jgi:hypothetical protein